MTYMLYGVRRRGRTGRGGETLGDARALRRPGWDPSGPGSAAARRSAWR